MISVATLGVAEAVRAMIGTPGHNLRMQDSLLYYERQFQKLPSSENCDELTSGLKSLPHVAMT